MKTLILIPALAMFLAALDTRAAQLYQLDWSGLDGGGGASQSGDAIHRGAIGGWLNRPMQSANYSINPGFPAAPVVGENTEVPSLRITLAGQFVRISWPSWAAAFLLEGNPTMSAGWAQVPDVVQQEESELFVLVPASEACVFYRLRAPSGE